MTIFSDRLRSLRDDKRLTVDEVASEVGISRSTLSNYETGARHPKKPILDAILDYYNVSLDYLEGKTDVKNVYDFNGIYNAGYKEGLTDAAGNVLKSTPVPIYSPLSCGTGAWIDEIPTDFVGIPIDVTKTDQVYFANRAQGNSMEPHIKNGDYLIFEKTEQIDRGKIGSFSLNCRHTYISILTESGTDERVVKALVGHAGGVTADVYTHYKDVELVREANRVFSKYLPDIVDGTEDYSDRIAA